MQLVRNGSRLGYSMNVMGTDWVKPGLLHECSVYGMGQAWVTSRMQWVRNGSSLSYFMNAVGTKWVKPE